MGDMNPMSGRKQIYWAQLQNLILLNLVRLPRQNGWNKPGKNESESNAVSSVAMMLIVGVVYNGKVE